MNNYLLSLVLLGVLTLSGCAKTETPAVDNVAATPPTSQVVQDNSGKTVLYWYDPMVADKKFDKPGKSPFMDMQLVPKYKEEGSQP